MENWDERSKKEKKHMLFNFDASGSMDQEYNENWQENKQLAISDANMVSEEEIASMMHGWLKKYFESIKELKLCSKGILSAHHQKFFSKALDHGLILQAIEAKLDPDLKALHGIKSLRVSVKKSTYAEHLDWFIPFLEKKFGEKWVNQRSKGEILRKFTNTLNYIWRKVYKNVYMLFILSEIFVRLEYLLPPGVSSLVLGGSIINRVGSHEEFKRLGKFVSEINDHTKMGTGHLLSFHHKKMGDDPFLIRAFLQESYQAEIWIRKRGVKWETVDYETGLRVMRSVLMGEQ